MKTLLIILCVFMSGCASRAELADLKEFVIFEDNGSEDRLKGTALDVYHYHNELTLQERIERLERGCHAKHR